MEIQEYIKNRLETQIEWYDKKAIHCRKYHENISVYCIIGTALSALLASISTSNPCYNKVLSIFAAIIAFSVTVFLSIDKLKKYQELHLQYRSTCEKLRQEEFLYLTKVAVYKDHDNPTNDELFVERCESIMTTENGNWAQLTEKKS